MTNFKCNYCGIDIIKSMSEQKKSKSKLFYCGRPCAAKYNNKCRKQKRKKYFCICGSNKSKGSERCWDCYRKYSKKNWLDFQGNKTLEETVQLNKKTLRSKYDTVRKHARSVIEFENRQCVCQEESCSFNFYVEVCHKKAISDFEKHTKLSEINHRDNLVVLCPNHHKMLDRGCHINIINK